ncbi:MAG: sugar phosphate isomerase/epimerase [Clostridia bacterium]|nr:sugar phosphate isomerase/epimerase [Clostridia bacterium]
MNIGIRLHDTAPGTLEQRLGFAKAQGFSCAHLALSKVVDGFSMADAPARLNVELAEWVKGAFADNGLECAVLGCYLQLATTDAEALARTQAIYRAHLRFACMMGAGVVGTETPLAQSDQLNIHDPEALALFLRCVEPLVRCAEEEGAILAIEPVACHIVNTPQRMEQVLDALKSDHVRVILDAVNLLTRDNHADAQAIVDEAIRRFGDRVSVLHMKDYTVDPDAYMTKACACGTGLMGYERLLEFAGEKQLPMTLENTTPENAEAARLFLERTAGGLK